MLLPHGYEGQGPEHSSARVERYLQLAADTNMLICQPTTAAQIFHLLRRQMVGNIRKPLIVFSPKSLLRNKMASSDLEELSEGKFETVIGEIEELDADKVRRILVCTGKVYYDLVKYRKEHEIDDVVMFALNSSIRSRIRASVKRLPVTPSLPKWFGFRTNLRIRAPGSMCSTICLKKCLPAQD